MYEVLSQKPSNAIMKLALIWSALRKEDQALPLLQRIRSEFTVTIRAVQEVVKIVLHF